MNQMDTHKEDENGRTPFYTYKVERKMLEMIVCPLTKTSLHYDAENQELISRSAHLAFPIRDGIPVMLPQEARILPD